MLPPGHRPFFAAAVRSIGSDVSPAFGYRDTPSLDLTMAVPNSGVSPLPVPAGFLDVTLTYSANSANTQCANATNTQSSAFLIQVAMFNHQNEVFGVLASGCSSTACSFEETIQEMTGPSSVLDANLMALHEQSAVHAVSKSTVLSCYHHQLFVLDTESLS